MYTYIVRIHVHVHVKLYYLCFYSHDNTKTSYVTLRHNYPNGYYALFLERIFYCPVSCHSVGTIDVLMKHFGRLNVDKFNQVHVHVTISIFSVYYQYILCILSVYSQYIISILLSGLPAIIRTTWRQLYIDNIKLRRNWRLGKAQTLTITKHRNRVLCVRIKETEGICGTGSNDHTIRIWRLKDGKLINTISEYGVSIHGLLGVITYTCTVQCTCTCTCTCTFIFIFILFLLQRVWSLCFYGLNFIISGCSDGLVKIWQYRTGKLVKYVNKSYTISYISYYYRLNTEVKVSMALLLLLLFVGDQRNILVQYGHYNRKETCSLQGHMIKW